MKRCENGCLMNICALSAKAVYGLTGQSINQSITRIQILRANFLAILTAPGKWRDTTWLVLLRATLNRKSPQLLLVLKFSCAADIPFQREGK